MQKLMSLVCLSMLVIFTSNIVHATAEPIPKTASTDANFEFRYEVSIPKPSQPFKEMDIWVPVPSDSPEQIIVKSTYTAPTGYKLTTEPEIGNKMLYVHLDSTQTFPVQIKAIYNVHRVVARPLTLDQLAGKQGWDPTHFLNSDRKVPLDGVIAKLGAEQSKGAKNDDDKVSSMFNYVTSIMTYNKDGTGWGQGDAIWACTNKRGNCTDFHSLLIGMARSQKIPAKFEMGFPIPNTDHAAIAGYHCWMRAYTKKSGWVPLDSSEANKSKNTALFYRRFPADRIQFSNGRDLNLEPRQHAEALNYFIYPYVEIDGKPSTELKKEFSFQRL